MNHDDARRRHGRRRRTIGGVAAAMAVAVAVPLALQLRGNDGDTAVPMPLPVGEGDRAAACAGAAGRVVDELPDSAARLWLCDESGDVVASRRGMQEPLAVGVDRALAAFRDLERAEPDRACTAEYTLSYVVVAEGGDGSFTPVMGELHGCRTIGNRLGGEGYLETLGELWAEQRAAQPRPGETLPVASLCSAPSSILPAALGDAAQAALCQAGDGTRNPPAGAEVPKALMERLRADIERGAVTGSLGEWEPVARLVFVDPWGQSVSLNRYGSGTFQWNDQVWRPTGEVASELDALMSQLDKPDPGTTVPVEERCDDARAAVATTGSVIGGEIESVGICVENPPGSRNVAPVSWLSDPAGVDRAMAAFNDLPVSAEPCESTAGAPVVFVEYRNASGVVAAVKQDSCGPSTGAVRKGGELVPLIVGLIHDSMGDGAGVHFAAQELCPERHALVPVDPTEGAIQVAACVGRNGELPVDLPAELVEAMATDITAGRPPSTLGFGEFGNLVWLNRFGEPITLMRAGDGSFVWQTPDGPRRWMPTGQVKEQLDRVFGL